MRFTLLVLEDNRALADVLVANCGVEGRKLLPKAARRHTDLELPRISGEVPIQEFRSLRPGLTIFAMSTGPDEEVGADLFFPKPHSTTLKRTASSV